MNSVGWEHAGDEVRLEDALFVISPLLAPDVLVFNDRSDDGVTGCIEPEEAVCLDFGFDAVDHSEDADGRAVHRFPVVVVSAVQIERPIARAERLPVIIVKLDVKNVRVEGARVVLAVDLRLLLQPVLERNVGDAPRDHWCQFIIQI